MNRADLEVDNVWALVPRPMMHLKAASNRGPFKLQLHFPNWHLSKMTCQVHTRSFDCEQATEGGSSANHLCCEELSDAHLTGSSRSKHGLKHSSLDILWLRYMTTTRTDTKKTQGSTTNYFYDSLIQFQKLNRVLFVHSYMITKIKWKGISISLTGT